MTRGDGWGFLGMVAHLHAKVALALLYVMAPTSFGKPQPTDLMIIIRSSDKELSVLTFIQLSYNAHIDIATLRICLYSFWKPFLIDTGLVSSLVKRPVMGEALADHKAATDHKTPNVTDVPPAYHDDSSSLSTDETQAGVKNIEIVSQTWSKWALIVAYLG